MKNFFLSGLLIFVASLNALVAQPPIIPPNLCQGPPPSGAFDCLAACVNCNLDGYTELSLDPNPRHVITDCYGTPMDVTFAHWYAFIAGSTTIAFDLSPIKCVGSDGIQALITEGCNTNKVLGCTVFTPGNKGNPIQVSGFGLIPGNVYQLCVGGADTSTCQFQISVAAGAASPLPMPNITSMDGPGAFCVGGNPGDYSIQPVQNAIVYTWTAPPGSMIDGGGNVKSFRAPMGTSIHVDYGQAGGVVCVTAKNYCTPNRSFCKTVTKEVVLPSFKAPITLCWEETPFVWDEPPFTSIEVPGTFILTSEPFESYLGCDSVVRQTITVRPQKVVNYPLFYLCENECFKVGGQDYCNAGAYTVSLTATNGCDSIINFSLAKLPAAAASQYSNTITCAQPGALLTSNGSTTGQNVSYQWYNGSLVPISNQQTVTVNSTGNYYLIVSNSVGAKVCKDTAALFLPASLQVPQVNAGPPKLINCFQPTTQLSGTASSGNQYTYQWTASNGGNIVSDGNTLTPTVNAIGTYTLLVTNTANGCSSSAITTVNGSFGFPAISATGGLINCAIPNINLQSTSSAPNSTYLWTGPNGFLSTQSNPNVNAAGFYNLVVTDPSNGCKSTATANVNADFAQPGSAVSAAGNINCINSSVNLTATATGGNAYSFIWKKPDGTTVPTGGSPNFTATTPGQYVVTVTNTGNGCTSSATTSVNTDFATPNSTVAVSGNLNCNNAAVNLTANTTGGTTYNYVWTKPDGSTVNTGNSPNLSANAPGQYILTTTNNGNGCTSSTSSIVNLTPTVNAAASVNQNVSCFQLSNGTATAIGSGGNGSYSYSWNNGATTASISNLSAGNYSVVITDGEGCTATAAVTISQPTALLLNVSATAESIFMGNNGAASATVSGGTAGYSYLWNNNATTADISGLAPGTYTVIVTDANGCTTSQSVIVNQYNCALAANIQTTNVSCFGGNNGTALINLTGGTAPINYNWSNGASGNPINNLAPGTYTVDIIDAAECPAELSFTITEPTLLEITATATNASGGNQNNGTATATASGGTSGYTYLWSNGATTFSIQNLSPGFYSVTTTDINGCTAETTVEVGLDDCGIAATFNGVQPTCFELANGQITVDIVGGSAPFTYIWTDGTNPADPTALPAGNYFVSITDVNGCELALTTSLSQPDVLTINIESTTSTICPTDPAGSATISTSGGTGNINIMWTNGQTGPTATGLMAGPIFVSAIDINGCETTTVVTIESTDNLAPVIEAVNSVLQLGPAGSIVLTEQNTGSTITDNCLVANVVFSPASFNCTQQGQHVITVTATDGVGNTSTVQFSVLVIDSLAPVMDCPDNIIRCFGDDIVSYNAPSVEDNCQTAGGTFSIDAGLSSGSQFPAGETVNTYSFTDVAGNKGECSFTVTILDILAVVNPIVVNDIDMKMVGSINITVAGGLPPYTFDWKKNGQPFATTEDIINIGMGVYTVKIVDSNGCTVAIQSYEVQSIVDANEPIWASQFQLVPNPTSGLLTAVFPQNLTGEAAAKVYDATGRLVFSKSFQLENKVQFDLTGLSDGLFVISIQLNKEVIYRKIVVDRD